MSLVLNKERETFIRVQKRATGLGRFAQCQVGSGGVDMVGISVIVAVPSNR